MVFTGIGSFESSVNSYDSQTWSCLIVKCAWFESSVNSYDSQTKSRSWGIVLPFESSVNSYDSQTDEIGSLMNASLRVV